MDDNGAACVVSTRPGEARVTDRLDEILSGPATGLLVEIYFGMAPSSADFPSFAGSLFDDLRPGDPDVFDIADLFALNLLDEMVGADAARRIVSEGVADEALSAVPADVDLWDADEAVLDAMAGLRGALLEVPLVGPTKASKLMARKRPRLVPIWDSVVQRELAPATGQWWSALAGALSDPGRLDRVRALDPHLDGYTPSALRLVDVAVWMTGSESAAARAARASVGLELGDR